MTDNTETYSEGSALAVLFGEGPSVLILSALLADPSPEHDYSISEIAELAGVSQNTVDRHKNDLLELGIITKRRESGGTPRYRLNKENPAAKRLAQLEWELSKELSKLEESRDD